MAIFELKNVSSSSEIEEMQIIYLMADRSGSDTVSSDSEQVKENFSEGQSADSYKAVASECQGIEQKSSKRDKRNVVQKKADSKPSFFNYIKKQIDELRQLGKNGTALNYERALNSFSSFMNGSDISIPCVSKQLVWQYNIYLSGRGLKRNSVSFYMRILRAIYNKAAKQKLTEQNFPFADVYTGIDKTRKRAVDESAIKCLYKLNLQDARLSFARDLFIFSYCAMGMAFVDMAFLKKEQIHDDYIDYTRQKTGQRIRVKLHHQTKALIDKYKDTGSPYVFPIIKSSVRQKAYDEYVKGINEYNKHLKKLEAYLPCNTHLSSYTARHSWATIAHNTHNLPVAVISAGLGHTSEKTTQIYLAEFDNSVIDNANKKITAALEK